MNRMKLFGIGIGLTLLTLGTLPEHAAAQPPGPGGGGFPKEVCFNVFCSYSRDHKDSKDNDYGYDQCQVGSVFKKLVGWDGRELDDLSEMTFHPDFEVECDYQRVFNGAGRRLTDFAGTRIQALTGPFPAIVMPKGALSDGHRYVPSALEFWGQTLRGYCYIYTGEQ